MDSPLGLLYSRRTALALNPLLFSLDARSSRCSNPEVYCVLQVVFCFSSKADYLNLISTAPANVAVEYYKDLTVFNGTLNYPSVYRGYPTPEIDAAWQRQRLVSLMVHNTDCLLNPAVGRTRLTREQLLMIGKEDTPSIVKYRKEDEGGYMASLEFTHQLHCLVNS